MTEFDTVVAMAEDDSKELNVTHGADTFLEAAKVLPDFIKTMNTWTQSHSPQWQTILLPGHTTHQPGFSVLEPRVSVPGGKAQSS